MKPTPVPNGPLVKKKGPFKGSSLKNGGKLKVKAGGENHEETGTDRHVGDLLGALGLGDLLLGLGEGDRPAG